MKTDETQPQIRYRKAKRKILLESALIVLIFHGLLLLLFKFAPEAPSVHTSPRRPVTLLDLNTLPEGDRNSWLSWLYLHDPALIAQPDSQNYSGRFIPVSRPVPTTFQVKVSSELTPEQKPEQYNGLPELNASFGSMLSGYQFAKLPELTQSPITLPRFHSNGVLVPQMKNLPDTIRNAVPPEAFTELEILPSVRPGGDWRYRVLKSSGDPDLERQLIHFLRQEFPAPAQMEQLLIEWKRQ